MRIIIAKALIFNANNEFLIIQRSNYKNDGTEGLWDFPGGRVDLNETVPDALIRELKEELNVDVTIDKLIYQDQDALNQTTNLHYYLFKTHLIKDVQFRLSHEHKAFKCIKPNQFKEYNYYLKDFRLCAIENIVKNETL